MAEYIFSSESVTEGHPDKIADQISDAILDAVLKEDPFGRVACETFVTTGLTLVGGEITTKCYVDIPATARNIIKELGSEEDIMAFWSDPTVAVGKFNELMRFLQNNLRLSTS